MFCWARLLVGFKVEALLRLGVYLMYVMDGEEEDSMRVLVIERFLHDFVMNCISNFNFVPEVTILFYFSI